MSRARSWIVPRVFVPRHKVLGSDSRWWEPLEGAHTLPRIEPPLRARHDPRERSRVRRGHRVAAKFAEILEISKSREAVYEASRSQTS